MELRKIFGKWSPRPFKTVKWYWTAFILLTLITISFENLTYRAFIAENKINDYGFSANSPNFFPIIAMQIFYFIEYKYDSGKFFKWCLSVSGFVIGYETIQIFMPNRTFDWKDILATILATIIGYIVLKKLHTKSVIIREGLGAKLKSK